MFAQMIVVENAARLALADFETPRVASRSLLPYRWTSGAAAIAGLALACAGFIVLL